MANIKWIGTQELGKDMEPLLTKYYKLIPTFLIFTIDLL